MSNITEKKCTKCGEVKSLSMFYKQKGGMYGIASQCKMCINIKTKQWKNNNKDKVYITEHNSYITNIERVKKYQSEYRKNNKEKINTLKKEYRKKNIEKVKEYTKKYYENNKEKIKEYRDKNPEKYKTKKYTKNMSDGYIASVLKINIAECPPELIELKRAQLQLKREILK